MSNILSSILPSFLSGLAFLVVFFFISLFLVVGIKVVFLHLENKLIKRNRPKKQTATTKKPPKKQQNVVKSIEINPEEVDKIYFKKIS